MTGRNRKRIPEPQRAESSARKLNEQDSPGPCLGICLGDLLSIAWGSVLGICCLLNQNHREITASKKLQGTRTPVGGTPVGPTAAWPPQGGKHCGHVGICTGISLSLALSLSLPPSMPFSIFLSLSRSPFFPSFSFALARSLSLSLAFSLSLSIYRQLLAQELHTDKDKLRPYVGYVTFFDHHLTRPPLLDYKGTSLTKKKHPLWTLQ